MIAFSTLVPRPWWGSAAPPPRKDGRDRVRHARCREHPRGHDLQRQLDAASAEPWPCPAPPSQDAPGSRAGTRVRRMPPSRSVTYPAQQGSAIRGAQVSESAPPTTNSASAAPKPARDLRTPPAVLRGARPARSAARSPLGPGVAPAPVPSPRAQALGPATLLPMARRRHGREPPPALRASRPLRHGPSRAGRARRRSPPSAVRATLVMDGLPTTTE